MTHIEKLESVLVQAVKLMDENGVRYWITDGTLLGVIRDGHVLPWDDDVDFGVLKNETPRSLLIEIFTNAGFTYIETLPEMDSLHFKIGSVQLDINMYTIEEEKMFIKWAVNPDHWVTKIAVQAINVIFEDTKNINKIWKNSGKDLSYLKVLIQYAGRLFSIKFKEKMFSFAKRNYKLIGAVYPAYLSKTKKIRYKGRFIYVPENSEEYLRLTFGNDWRIQKRNFNWTDDTYNLERFN